MKLLSRTIAVLLAIRSNVSSFIVNSSPVGMGKIKSATGPLHETLYDETTAKEKIFDHDKSAGGEVNGNTSANSNSSKEKPINASSTASEQFELKPDYAKILQASSDAQHKFSTLTQEQTDLIFTEVAKVASKARVPLAKFAVEETGMGCMEDKVIKNSLACELIHDRYKNSKTCGMISGDDEHGLRTFAHPVGPVCAITPVTNPTSTAIAKCLMLAKTRNAGVSSLLLMVQFFYSKHVYSYYIQ